MSGRGTKGAAFPTTVRAGRFENKWVKSSMLPRLKNLNRKGTPKKKLIYNQVFMDIPGRHVVELNYLAQQLICPLCPNQDLHLKDICNVTQFGLASILQVRCINCKTIRAIRTCKRAPEDSREYVINMKCAIGMIDAGIGPTHVNAFFSAMNLPAIADTTLKRHENIVGVAIEEVAKNSCLEYAKKERVLTIKKKLLSKDECLFNNVNDCTSNKSTLKKRRLYSSLPDLTETCADELSSRDVPPLQSTLKRHRSLPQLSTEGVMASIGIQISSDMGWQKRGNGKQYNSQTGHLTFFGTETGKILDYIVMTTCCYRCKKQGGKCNLPTCRKNYEGSAKSMEAEASVRLIKSDVLAAAMVHVELFIADEDSSTTAAIRRNFGNAIKKASDVMHSQKILKNDLYTVKSSNKELTADVIKYMVSCAGVVIKKNKGDPEKIASGLRNIPDHVFGNHDNCGDWCRYIQDPEAYTSKYHDSVLGPTGSSLHSKVVTSFQKLVNHADQLAPCGTTQPNESANNTVGSKARKTTHYGSSQSLSFRVGAAVSQTNCSVKYVVKVNEELGISPGENTIKHRNAVATKRKKESDASKLPQNKKRRKLFNNRKSSATTRKESSEIDTYRPGMGFDVISTEPAPPHVIPKPRKIWRTPAFSSLPRTKITNEHLEIYFDVETTGKNPKVDEILQISALSASRGEFNCYVKPRRAIPPESTKVHNITCVDGVLHYNNVPVMSHTLVYALKSFLNFVKDHNNPVLIAHNAPFDINFIYTSLERQKLVTELSTECVILDTLPMARQKYPKKKNTDLQNHQLQTLVLYCLGKNYNFEAHNAAADVRALKDLLVAMAVTTEEKESCSYTFGSYLQRKNWARDGEVLGSELSKCGVKCKDLQNLVTAGWSLATLKNLCCNGNLVQTQATLKLLIKKAEVVFNIQNHFKKISTGPTDANMEEEVLDMADSAVLGTSLGENIGASTSENTAQTFAPTHNTPAVETLEKENGNFRKRKKKKNCNLKDDSLIEPNPEEEEIDMSGFGMLETSTLGDCIIDFTTENGMQIDAQTSNTPVAEEDLEKQTVSYRNRKKPKFTSVV